MFSFINDYVYYNSMRFRIHLMYKTNLVNSVTNESD